MEPSSATTPNSALSAEQDRRPRKHLSQSLKSQRDRQLQESRHHNRLNLTITVKCFSPQLKKKEKLCSPPGEVPRTSNSKLRHGSNKRRHSSRHSLDNSNTQHLQSNNTRLLRRDPLLLHPADSHYPLLPWIHTGRMQEHQPSTGSRNARARAS